MVEKMYQALNLWNCTYFENISIRWDLKVRFDFEILLSVHVNVLFPVKIMSPPMSPATALQ